MGSFEKPLLIYDGECGFCKRWISLWQEMTGPAVEYRPSQEVGKDFPQISAQEFDLSVVLALPSGEIFHGAEAVLRTLVQVPRYAWITQVLATYKAVPVFAAIMEFCYSLVARNRVFFSWLTWLFYGENVTRPSYLLTRWLFIKGLGVVYLAAFLSLGSQIHGLVGASGILRAGWSDLSLDMLWISGAVGSVLLILGIAPLLVMAGIWVAYYYLVQICGEFLGFQWDNLMLEMGFLAIFLAPLSLVPKFPPRFNQEQAPSFTPILLLRWLLFRVVFFSGWVKLASGDQTWRSLTALTYHFETQPLPTFISWYVHQAPLWFHKILTCCLFVIELGAPFFIFLPRRPRVLACIMIVGLQVFINLTGNYGFFGWQVVCLCLLLVDDSFWQKLFPKSWVPWIQDGRTLYAHAREPEFKRWLNYGVATTVLLVTLFHVETLNRVINRYGVFAVMTTHRDEIIIEGSYDGQSWLPYEFRYKPGDLRRAPSFVTFHMPRLDWQMWFAALDSYEHTPWVGGFMARLLEGSPPILKLLGHNPFENQPPRYIRALRYGYKFSDPIPHQEQGDWWKRELIGPYSPILTLKQD
ncbi:MAG: lipase maturation factor family protein [Bdellovibrionia bacterium]